MRFFSEGVELRVNDVVLYNELLFVPRTQLAMLELEFVFNNDTSCWELVRDAAFWLELVLQVQECELLV